MDTTGKRCNVLAATQTVRILFMKGLIKMNLHYSRFAPRESGYVLTEKWYVCKVDGLRFISESNFLAHCRREIIRERNNEERRN